MKREKHPFIIIFVCLFFLVTGKIIAAEKDNSLKLHYTFKNVTGNIVTDDTGNGYDGTLLNSATINTIQDFSILNLGLSNGYLDMGSKTGSLISDLEDFTIAVYLYIDDNSNITGNGNFVWVFSTLESCSDNAGKYIAYRVNRQRYALSTGGWKNEVTEVEKGTPADKGVWQHLVYTQSGNTGTIYINGKVLATKSVSTKPKDIGTTVYNWLGRPQFSADSYLKGASYTDFRIYDRALTSEEINDFQPALETLNNSINANDVEAAKSILNPEGLDAVRNNLNLPGRIGNQVDISWNSSNQSVLANDGTVFRPSADEERVTLTLTATLSKGDYTATKEFEVTVMPKLNDEDAAKQDADNISINTANCYSIGKLQLPTTGIEESIIEWESGNSEYLTPAGEIIKLPAKGEGNITIELTAKIKNGSFTETRKFNICISEETDFSGYLFAYFTGSNEDIFFALSLNGYTYKALNSGNPVIKGSDISDKGGVRDPHILRGNDGKYYMVVTDMRASQGWDSNHGIVLMKSDDLVNWTHSKIDIKNTYPEEFGTITRAWAPQTFYDHKTGKYMVYFSTKKPNEVDIIYYAYTNDDFTALEEAPKQLFFHPENKACIDGDIIYKDGLYHLFFKTEGNGDGIKKAVSENLTSGYELQDRYLQQTNLAVEGSCVFKLINQDKYILMYDVYKNGKYEFTESTDLENFTLTEETVSMDFAPRHGTVMAITEEEAIRLAEKWGTASLVTFGSANAPGIKSINTVINESAKTIYLPVKYGTNIDAFDPQIKAIAPGVNITPKGVQNFTDGPVNYTFELNGTTKTYNVTAAVNNNPVIEGYFADPEILYSEKTGKFYIYPTSDGFTNWGGYYFNVFSSEDLVNWTNHGKIIDMHTDQVQWANGNAWAPCIIEKKIGNEYKYFFYFSGGMDGGAKKIGVAVADDPTGPFTVSKQPLIDSSPAGGGQQIDPDVFTDPKTGKSYIYWGNAYLAGAELNDDMVSIKTETIKIMTPKTTFTEAVYVFYRNGKYYFMWSEGNTNNKSYKVWYGTADSPLGTINIPANNNILKLDESLAIFGPGHNSVIQIPGTDEWYIVYHRISRPNGITKSQPGNFREICIDKLEFNGDGTIKQIIPTLEGINPVDLSQTGIKNSQLLKNRNEVEIYPTLVKNNLNIKTGLTDKPATVSFLDVNGRTVRTVQTDKSETSIDCTALSRGFYLVTVKIGNSTYTQLIKKH